jgi:KGK domain
MDLSKMYQLLPSEVVTLETPGYYLSHPTNRISEIQAIIKNHLSNDLNALVSVEGVKCEALSLGVSEWKSGRLRLVLLFEPDEPAEEESSEKDELDESLSELQRLADS